MEACRVLVVEDDPADRARAVAALAAAGHEIAEACHGREALDHLDRGGAPHVVVLDLMMPVMDGATFLRALHAQGRRRGLGVVITTALASRHVTTLLGADAYLFKPFDPDELRRAVARVCAGAGP